MSTEAPFEVVEPYTPEPCDDQTGGDVIDAAKGVRFEIKKASSRENEDKATGEVKTRSLSLQAKVGPLGTNGEGKYAGKVMFVDLMTWYNKDICSGDWWEKQARFPWKCFMVSQGLDPKSPPTINDEFLQGLTGKEFIGDITVQPIRYKCEESGKWEDSGEKRNEVRNIKKAE